MIRPGVQRYRDQDSAWMLNKREAGGGVLLNLGVHGFDLVRLLTGEEPEVIGAITSNAVFGLDVEDYAATPGWSWKTTTCSASRRMPMDSPRRWS